MQEPEQDAADQISEASWLRLKHRLEDQGSEALLSLVLQDVTALSSSFLCAMWALPVGFIGICALVSVPLLVGSGD